MVIFKLTKMNDCYHLELIEDPVTEEKERRRKAVEKWTKETNDKFASRYNYFFALLAYADMQI